MKPPPYEWFSSHAKFSKHDEDHNAKVGVPPWLMERILAIGPHSERFRLSMEYIKRRGSIVKERETALKLQDNILRGAIQKVTDDVAKFEITRIGILWSIAKAERHRVRTFLKLLYRDEAWSGYMYFSLEYVGKDEARQMHQTAKENIWTAFREAVRELDEEYGILLDAMQDGDEKAVMVESIES